MVTYAAITGKQFPAHVVNTTVIGRISSKDTIVNVDIALNHDDKVGTPFIIALTMLHAQVCAFCTLPIVVVSAV